MPRKTWCDDWTCPARVSCAHHFGRSKAYAAMASAKTAHGFGTPYDRFETKDDPDSCGAYRFDRPKPWLMPRPDEIFLQPGTTWP